MKAKTFPTLAVLGAYTGIVLEERGFGSIHDVFDFFYPGIMTLGVAAMSENIKPLLVANAPGIEQWDKERCQKLGWKEFGAAALSHFGETIELRSSGRDATFGGLENELAYIRKHRPETPVAVVVIEATK